MRAVLPNTIPLRAYHVRGAKLKKSPTIHQRGLFSLTSTADAIFHSSSFLSQQSAGKIAGNAITLCFDVG